MRYREQLVIVLVGFLVGFIFSYALPDNTPEMSQAKVQQMEKRRARIAELDAQADNMAARYGWHREAWPPGELDKFRGLREQVATLVKEYNRECIKYVQCEMIR